MIFVYNNSIMNEDKQNIIDIPIQDEIKNSYLTYAMSVIISRALPDVRDGLKPVHRRILYGMFEMGLEYNKAPKKSARIVGDVMGKYHPHGDSSVYDALVRLAQDFSLRYPLIFGQGNFGSVDGDPPAAMRYTEARMQKITSELLKDIEKDTVDFNNNYDDSLLEPVVLPAKLPSLLINGSNGIAVGMATNIPPHNLSDVITALIHIIDKKIINEEIFQDDLIDIVKMPDFPTGGLIFGLAGAKSAYLTGRGKITIRSKYKIEDNKTHQSIVFYEIPYMVNKANLVIQIAGLIKETKLEGISDLRDESDRTGLRIVLDLKKNANIDYILNILFSSTNLQNNFNINILALVNGSPKTLTLIELLSYFLDHRIEVIKRKINFDLNKANEKLHILEGLKIVQQNTDDIIKYIRSSENTLKAKEILKEKYAFSDRQVDSVLELKLNRLTSLELTKIERDYQDLTNLIEEYQGVLNDENKILNLIKDENLELIKNYGDERLSEISSDELEDIEDEDLIKIEDIVIIITQRGYIKRVALSSYRIQGRGGRGSSSSNLIEGDLIKDVFVSSTHDYILVISTFGRSYWLKAYQINQSSKTSRGTHIKNIFNFDEDEEISSVMSLKEFSHDRFIFFATKKGIIKRSSTYEFRNAKKKGVNAISLKEDDKVVTTFLSDGISDILLITKLGYSLRFLQKKLRPMGRAAAGNKGIKLQKNNELVSALELKDDYQVLIITDIGIGKQINPFNLHAHGTNTKGQIIYKSKDKFNIADAILVKKNDNIIVLSAKGNSIKSKVNYISEQGFYTKGVKIVNLQENDYVVSITRSSEEEEDNEEED